MDKKFLEECLDKGMSTRQIEKICDLKRSVILYWIHKHNLEGKMKYQSGNSYKFEKIDTKEKAYTLGFILADGCISENNNMNLRIQMYDKKVLDFISKVIDARVHTNHILNKKNRKFPHVSITKRINDITKFTGGRLKEDRHYPRIREDLERYLIQGLFDADGCITWGRRKDKNRIWQKISFTSQYKILYGVQQYLLKKLDISTSIHPKSKEKCYVLEFSNLNDVLTFCEHIYPNEDFIILNRKYLKYKALRLELEENGKTDRSDRQYRAERTEYEGVETSGAIAK